jgi:hypothetical protein
VISRQTKKIISLLSGSIKNGKSGMAQTSSHSLEEKKILPFGTICCFLVYVHMLWPFGIFCGHLIDFMTIWYTYFMTICYTYFLKENARGGEQTRVLLISIIFSFFTTLPLSHSGSPAIHIL